MSPLKNLNAKRRAARRMKAWRMNGAMLHKDGSLSVDLSRYDPSRPIPFGYHANFWARYMNGFSWKPLYPDKMFDENPGVILGPGGKPAPPAPSDMMLPTSVIYSERYPPVSPEQQARDLEEARRKLAQFHNDHHTPDPK